MQTLKDQRVVVTGGTRGCRGSSPCRSGSSREPADRPGAQRGRDIGDGPIHELTWEASYANGVSDELGLGIKFQVILPRQLIGDTELGRAGRRRVRQAQRVPLETFLASFGTPMPPSQVGEHIVTLLTDAKYESGTASGLKGDLGIHALDS